MSIVVLMFTYSCIAVKKDHRLFRQKVCGYWYVFTPPEGYIKEYYYFSEHDYGQEYIYPDSSKFYVVTFSNTSNYEYIREQGTYYLRFWAYYTGDTMTLTGKSKNGLYWKDKLIGCELTIGYTKVKPENINKFEKGIKSIRKCNLICKAIMMLK